MGKIVLVIIFIGLISACASAQTSNIGRQLVGKWVNLDVDIDSDGNCYEVIFNSDGTGSINGNKIKYAVIIGNKVAITQYGKDTEIYDIFILSDGKTLILCRDGDVLKKK